MRAHYRYCKHIICLSAIFSFLIIAANSNVGVQQKTDSLNALLNKSDRKFEEVYHGKKISPCEIVRENARFQKNTQEYLR
jgi:hypothetical protein